MQRKNDVIERFLQPGEIMAGNAKHRVRTLLGSCVSITLWHPVHKYGAMSHFLLSARNAPPGTLDARYGEEALCLMLRELRRAQVAPGECVGKIFGGGNMFPEIGSDLPNVGRRNGEAARQLLGAPGIPVVSERLFGVGHRQIVFDIASGHVWARQIEPRVAAQIMPYLPAAAARSMEAAT